MTDFFNYFPVTSKASYFVPDMQERVRRLLSGLDEDSVQTVTRTLQILKTLTDADFTGAPHPELSDVFTPDEVAAIRANDAKLADGVKQIAPDTWAFDDYLLPISEFEYSSFIDHYGLDAIDRAAVPDDSVILDVGGYVGDTAILFRRFFPENKVYTFEPMTDNFALTQKTIAMNHAEGMIVPVQLALSDVPESAGRAISLRSISRLDDTGNTVFPVDTLDHWMVKNQIGRVGLLKVDIEGGEQKFLRGAEQTIRKNRPLMLLSIYHNPDDYFGIKPWVEGLNLGYKFKIFKPMYRNVITETLLICIPQ